MWAAAGQVTCMMQKFFQFTFEQKATKWNIPITYLLLVPEHTKVESYLIGDSAYPLTPHCMKEFETCSTNAKVVFNNMLRSARNPIECTFGRLTARWSFLTKKVDLKLELIPAAVYACFVLHNICEQHMFLVDLLSVEKQVRLQMHNEQKTRNIPDPIFSGNLEEGAVIRDIITLNIEHNLPDHLVA